MASGPARPEWQLAYVGGGDSGWESYRHRVFGRWPTARLAPWCTDEAAYDAAIEERISAHEAIDAHSVYWYACLSTRFPTVEFRIADKLRDHPPTRKDKIGRPKPVELQRDGRPTASS